MKSVAERRAQFAAHASEDIAGQLGDGFKRLPPKRGWTTRAVWFERHDELLGVVGEQEGSTTDTVLAHGLSLAHGRPLRLALPLQWSYPTRFRQPWITADLEIWTHSRGTVSKPQPLTKQESRAAAGDCESSRPYRLGPVASQWVRALTEWATSHEELVEAHRRNLRGWSCNGQRVLTIEGKHKVKIKAGIDAKDAPATPHVLDGPLASATLKEIQKQVSLGIRQAHGKQYGKFEEHHMQGQLRRYPNALLLEEPLLREVPAWRPAGGQAEPRRGRGFIDLAGMDGAGDIVVVETKLDSDEMLILQGLDYWVWATRDDNATWLRDRLYAHTTAPIKLLFAIGGKGGDAPKIGKYERAHLEVLSPEIDWRIAKISQWNGARVPKVEMLPPCTSPEPG